MEKAERHLKLNNLILTKSCQYLHNDALKKMKWLNTEIFTRQTVQLIILLSNPKHVNLTKVIIKYLMELLTKSLSLQTKSAEMGVTISCTDCTDMDLIQTMEC